LTVTVTVGVEPGKVFSGGHLSMVWISWRSTLLTGALQCCVEVRHVPSAASEQRWRCYWTWSMFSI